MTFSGQPDDINVQENPEIKEAKALADMAMGKLATEHYDNKRWSYRHLEQLKTQHESIGPFTAWLYRQLDDNKDHPLVLTMLRLALVATAEYAQVYGGKK